MLSYSASDLPDRSPQTRRLQHMHCIPFSFHPPDAEISDRGAGLAGAGYSLYDKRPYSKTLPVCWPSYEIKGKYSRATAADDI